MRAIILFAHGSRNPKSIEEVESLAQQLDERVGDSEHVVHAFLDVAPPPLPEVIDRLVTQGTTTIDILPLFLNSGNHVQKDVPELVAHANAKYPEVRIQLLRHIGADPRYLALVESIILNPEERTQV